METSQMALLSTESDLSCPSQDDGFELSKNAGKIGKGRKPKHPLFLLPKGQGAQNGVNPVFFKKKYRGWGAIYPKVPGVRGVSKGRGKRKGLFLESREGFTDEAALAEAFDR